MTHRSIKTRYDLPVLNIKLYDEFNDHVFQNNKYWTYTGNQRPSSIQWTKDYTESSQISVYVDSKIFDAAFLLDSNPTKIAWLFESREIEPKTYFQIGKKRKILERFDMVATHDMSVVEKLENACFVPVGGMWVDSTRLYTRVEKDRLCSMIASNKIVTKGHRLRQEVIKSFPKDIEIDFWGSSVGRPFAQKDQALEQYMYSICIMNANYDTYFTEILTDCLLKKTVPIFWGSERIREIFDPNGFIFWSEIPDLIQIVKSLSASDYFSRLISIERNFQIALELSSSEMNLRRAIYQHLGI